VIKWYSQHSGWPKKIPAAWPWISQVARLFVAGDPRVIPGSPPTATTEAVIEAPNFMTRDLRASPGASSCVALRYAHKTGAHSALQSHTHVPFNSQPCLDSQRAQLWVHQAWHPNNGPHSHKPLRALGTECHLRVSHSLATNLWPITCDEGSSEALSITC
jgi:hypothetical protein